MASTYGSLKGIDSYYRNQWPSGYINWHNHIHTSSNSELSAPTWIRYETNKWFMFLQSNAQGTNGEEMQSLYRHFNGPLENHILTGSSSPPGGYSAGGRLGYVFKNNGSFRVPIYRFRKEYYDGQTYGAAQKITTTTRTGVVKRIKLRATNSSDLSGGVMSCLSSTSGVFCFVQNGADTNTAGNTGCIDPNYGSGYRNFSWTSLTGSGSGLITHMRLEPLAGSGGNLNNLRVKYPGTWFNAGGGDFGEGGLYWSGGSGYSVGDRLAPDTGCTNFDTNSNSLFEVTQIGSVSTSSTTLINRIDHRTSTDRIDLLNDGWIYEGIQGYAPLRKGGCTDSSANNYDPTATEDNGTCSYIVYGCTDSNANNYDSNADEDDGSCTYTPEFDHGFRLTSTAPNGGFSDNITVDEGVSFQMKLDWHKANDIKNTGYIIGFEFQENDGSSTASLSDFNGSTSAEYSINSNSGYVTYSATAKEDISSSEGTETMRVAFYTKTSASANKAFYAAKTVTVNDTSFQIFGCTDSTAFNYDSNANTDDGSCVPFIYGCTDSEGLNYNSNANTEDGSCYYNTALQLNRMEPENIVLRGGSTTPDSVSSTLVVRWVGNRNNYLTGDNGTTDYVEIYRQDTDGFNGEFNSFVDTSDSSEITYLGPGPSPGYSGLYELRKDIELKRVVQFNGEVNVKIPHEFSINTFYYDDDLGTFEEGDRDFVSPGTGTYFWHVPEGTSVADSNPSFYDGTQISSFKDRESRTLIFKYVGFNTFNSIDVYWDITGVGGIVTAAQAFATTSGVVATSLDVSSGLNFAVGSLGIPITALAPATTEPSSFQLTLRLNNSNGVIVWQQTFQLTEPAPVMLSPSFANSDGDVITTVPLKNNSVADDPFYHVVANWSYDTVSGGLPETQQYQIVKVSGWSGTSGSIPVGDRVFTFDDNASGSALLRETYFSPALTVPGDTIRFIIRGINDGGISGTFGDLVAYDPVVINSYGYSQGTINNAVVYTSTGTPTLRATVGQVITLEFNVQYLSQYVIQRKFENDVVDLTTVGDRATNDFNSPTSFSGTLDIDQEDLPIGASELILKIYGHANDVRTQKVIVESYIPVSLTTTVTDDNISVGDSTTINLQFSGSTDGDIIMMPGNISIPIPQSGNTIPVVVTPDITTNYKFTLNGLGGDTTVAYRTINTSLPPQIDYFATTQNPIQKGDNYGIYWGVSGNYQSIDINGVAMTGNSGTYTQFAPNVDGDITHVITVVGLLGQTIQETYTVTIKDIFYGSDTEGAENILFNEIVRGGDLDPATTPQTIVIPFNNLNTVINVCGAAGGDGAPSGSSPVTTGGAGGKGLGATFDWPDFNSSSLQVNPGQKGQTRTTSCTSCSSNGGLGLYGGAPSGSVVSGGSGGGGGAATAVYEGDNQTVIVEAGGGGGGGGASLGGYSGLSGTQSSGWNATTGNIGHSTGAVGGNANPNGGGSGGGDGGGGTSSTNTPSLTPSSGGYDNNTAAEGGEGGLSIYRNDLLTIRANIPGFPTTNLAPPTTYGDGWVWVQYVTGIPKIVSFTVTPVDNVGSNIFDIRWETEGMLNVVVEQDGANATIDDQNLTGEYIGWSSNLISIAGVLSPATDSFTITANGYDSEIYTQTINVTVVNDTTPDTDNWETTNETEPNTQIAQNLGNLISELPVTLYNQPLSGVSLGPSNNGPWSNEFTFQPGQVVWIRYFSLPFNTDVTDQTTGELLTGLYGNTNDKPIEIYAGGRWFPELEGTSIVVSGSGPYGEAGKGELGGFVTPGDTKGILLMGSYGDTAHTPVRTATWSKNTTNFSEIRINHISGNGSNGGESPDDENEVLELVIDPNDGTTPRVVEIVPKRSSVTKPATSRYFISGNVPQYYPCAARPNATLTAISYNSDRSVVFCWYSETYQVNDYDQQYGNWQQTGVPLLPNEKVSNCTFTLRSYGSDPEFSNSIPSNVAANNKNAGDLFGIDQIIYVEPNGNTSSDQPGTFRVDFLAKTRPPVIHENFDYQGIIDVDAFPDIDFNDENSTEYMLSNSIQVDDIELFRSDQALEIRSDDPNVEVKINSLAWQNVREIEE